MNNKLSICLSILVAAGAIYFLCADVSAGNVGPDMLRLPLISVILICQIFRSVFAENQGVVIPSELAENEDYIVAKNRVYYGIRLGIAGVLMVVVPVTALVIFKGIHGFWAQLSVYSFLGGIAAAIAGTVIFVLGKHEVTMTEAKCFEETPAQREPENKIVKICNIVSLIASIGLLAVILIG